MTGLPMPNELDSKLKIDGILCQAQGTKFGEAAYFCRQGRRHYLRAPSHLSGLGKIWPNDVIQVPEAVLDAFAVGSIVPGINSAQDMDTFQTDSSIVMRECMASVLSDRGIEIGAGASPFPVPLHCQVLYGDQLSYAELLDHRYPGQSQHEMPVPDVTTSLDTLEGIADDSMNFIIACHVIEHTKSPIGAIVAAWKKLRKGGYLLLVVPDKERTFDKERPLTTLPHLIADFENYDRARDYQHYEEFYQLAFPQQENVYRSVVDKAFRSNGDIHYHVWNRDSFMTMVSHINEHIIRWTEITSRASLGIEFYVRLRK
ncbi:MAG: methyltransferase domain-containing protein [Afipia sp.]|mgnify:CR=1 FL=1|nr:methyltransferase domain-containing protein [Afipia sp.]